MPTKTPVKYQTQKTENGFLIKDVVVAVAGDVKDRGITLDEKLFTRFIEYFNKRTSRGYTGAFVLLNHGGPRVGKIVKLTAGDQLLADMLIEDEHIAEKVKNGDLTDLSITFSAKLGILKDVSLLDNDFGQLNEDIPALIVDASEEFDVDDSDLIMLSYSELTDQRPKIEEKRMALTEEDLAAIGTLIDEKIAAALDNGDATSEEGEGSVEEMATEIANKRLAAKDAEIEKFKREHEINSYVMALSSKTNRTYSEKTLRKIFQDIKTSEGRKIKFDALMQQSEGSAKADIEEHYSKPTVEMALKEEYRAKEDHWKKLGISEDKYVRMNLPKAVDLK